MKRLLLYLSFVLSISSFGQTIQKKVSDYYTKTTLEGFVFGYSGATSYKYPLSIFGANQIDSTSVGQGPVYDTTWFWKNSTKRYFKLYRASTTGGNTSAPTAPTPSYGDASVRVSTTQFVKTLRDSLYKQIIDSLHYVDTTRKFVLANTGGGFALFDGASNDTLKALTLASDGSVSITRVGNTASLSVSLPATVGNDLVEWKTNANYSIPTNVGSLIWNYSNSANIIFLPSASSSTAHSIEISNSSGSSVNISPNFYDGNTGYSTIANGKRIKLRPDGVNWLVVQGNL